jgi:DNA polymerase III subunit beta
MKFTIQTSLFRPVIASISGLAGRRSTLPILSNVLIEASAEGIKFTATDLDVEISHFLPCSVAANGSVVSVSRHGSTTIPAKRLFSIIGALPDSPAEFESNDKNVCKIKCGSSRYEINGLSISEWPKPMELEKGDTFTIPANDLASSIRRTAFCASTEASRAIMCVLALQIKDSTLFIVATDGRRVAIDEISIDLPKVTREALLPTPAFTELERIVSGDGVVSVTLTERHARFVCEHVVMTTRLFDGNYPNWRLVVPSAMNNKIAIDRDEFLSAVKRASVMASEASFSVKLKFSKNLLTVKCNSTERGNASESVDIKYDSKEIDIAFSPKYLIDVLSHLTESEITMGLIDELSPAVISTTGAFIHVIMPMRLS